MRRGPRNIILPPAAGAALFTSMGISLTPYGSTGSVRALGRHVGELAWTSRHDNTGTPPPPPVYDRRLGYQPRCGILIRR